MVRWSLGREEERGKEERSWEMGFHHSRLDSKFGWE